MTKQQDLDHGYPQSDPSSDAPPKGVSWLAMVLVSLGLIAGLLILGPALQFFQGE